MRKVLRLVYTVLTVLCCYGWCTWLLHSLCNERKKEEQRKKKKGQQGRRVFLCPFSLFYMEVPLFSIFRFGGFAHRSDPRFKYTLWVLRVESSPIKFFFILCKIWLISTSLVCSLSFHCSEHPPRSWLLWFFFYYFDQTYLLFACMNVHIAIHCYHPQLVNGGQPLAISFPIRFTALWRYLHFLSKWPYGGPLLFFFYFF